MLPFPPFMTDLHFPQLPLWAGTLSTHFLSRKWPLRARSLKGYKADKAERALTHVFCLSYQASFQDTALENSSSLCPTMGFHSHPAAMIQKALKNPAPIRCK